MRRRVVVTGLGVLSPLGDSAGAFHRALCDGASALAPVAGFATDLCPGVTAGELRDFEPGRYLDGNLRPLDRASMLAGGAARLALADAAFPDGGRPREAVADGVDIGLVLGTMFGSIRTISEFDRRGLTAGPSYVSPLVFANTVINAAAGQTAIRLGLTGVNSTIAGGKASGLQALAVAADFVASGRSEVLLAGGVEELCLESLLGFWRARLVAGSDGAAPVAVPLDARRNGFLPGEGAALLVLETAETAARRGARVRGEILGHGGAFDPSRGADAERAAGAVKRAVEIALAAAGVAAADVGCCLLSASGGRATDAHEARGLAAALGGAGRAPEDLPITAIQGQTGETLGASGALQAVVALESLAAGRLPGVRGWAEVDRELPLRPSAEPAAPRGPLALLTTCGLDGTAAAVVLRGPDPGLGTDRPDDGRPRHGA